MPSGSLGLAPNQKLLKVFIDLTNLSNLMNLVNQKDELDDLNPEQVLDENQLTNVNRSRLDGYCV